MRIKRIISFLLIAILFANMTFMSVTANEFDSLLSERDKYIEEYGYGGGELGFMYPFMIECRLTVLLYTEQAKTFTYQKIEYDGYGETYCGPSSENYLCGYRGDGSCIYIVCPEITEAVAVKECYSADGWIEERCALQACIRYFDISKEELILANKKMREDPDSIREKISFLTEEEIELLRKDDNGLFCLNPLPDFMIEALYMEDTEIAYSLLRKPYAVYVKELDQMITCSDLSVGYMFLNELITYDLTSESMGEFIDYCESWGIKKDKIEILRNEREAQLKAAQTGDSAVSALWVIALALPALTVVAVKRKRRI